MWSTLGGLRRAVLATLEADGGCRDSNSEACGGGWATRHEWVDGGSSVGFIDSVGCAQRMGGR